MEQIGYSTNILPKLVMANEYEISMHERKYFNNKG